MDSCQHSIPVVTLDGLSGSGKGAVGLRLSHALSWHYLDSGILYRLLAFEAVQQAIPLDDEIALAQLSHEMYPQLHVQHPSEDEPHLVVTWRGQTVTHILRTEEYGLKAAQVAVYPAVRTALLDVQRNFRQMPGLIADGRDMGKAIFPDALCKFFLTASVDIRTQRRTNQLKQQRNYASLSKVENAIVQRDNSDQIRLAETLQVISDACIIDTTYLSIVQVMAIIEQKLSTVGLSFH